MLVPIAVSREAETVSSRAVAALARVAGAFLSWCARCYERAEQRRDLAELEDRMLRDVGLTRADAVRESGKPFWKE